MYSKGLLAPVHPLDIETVRKSFVQQWQRKVNTDFCDVSINNVKYACSLKWRGDKVLLRAPLGVIPEVLEVYDLSGRKKLGSATRHDRSKRRFPDPKPIPEDKTDYSIVLEKIRDHHRAQEISSTSNLDHLPEQRGARAWTLATFVTRVCEQAEVEPTTLDDHDLQLLSLVFGGSQHWTVAKLKSTWKSCETGSLQQFLIELSKLS